MRITVFFVYFFSLLGCKDSTTPSVRYTSLEYAIYEDKPVFEDAFLFPKQKKSIEIVASDNFDIYLVDWNSNGVYDEEGIDYIGVKSALENKANIELNMAINYVEYNGELYQIQSKGGEVSTKKSNANNKADLSLIDEYLPIALEDGQLLQPTFETDSTVIYFWATWCAPCIKTLKELGPKVETLKAQGIDFIPVAHNCSDSGEFLNKFDLPFTNHVVKQSSADQYNVYGLPEQFTFLKNRRLAASNVKLKRFYKGE